MNKKIILLVVGVVIIAGITLGVVLFMKAADNLNSNNGVVANTNVANTNTVGNVNTNESIDENTNAGSAVTQSEVVASGMVFLKGYDTPSESYGILTTAGHEIGLGKYDTMKEQFRAYIGEQVKVTFESICRTTNEDCCRTLFPYCGTVKEWEPIENTNINSQQ
jgi:hypothetical protein